MLERAVEHHLQDLTRAAGGACVKLGLNGWPDRMVLLPSGVCAFIELKRPGKRPTGLQLKRLRDLQALGFLATWTDSLAGVEAFVRELCHA